MAPNSRQVFPDSAGYAVPLNDISQDTLSNQIGHDPLYMIYQNDPARSWSPVRGENSCMPKHGHVHPSTSTSKIEVERVFLRESDGSAWTAARCLRLLRPLRAALHTLRRDDWLINKAGPNLGYKKRQFAEPEFILLDSDGEDEPTTSVTESGVAASPEDTAEYLPTRPVAVVRRTYSTRMRPRKINYCDNEDISFVPPRVKIIPFRQSRPCVKTGDRNVDAEIEDANLEILTDTAYDVERKANLKAVTQYRKNKVTNGKYMKVFHAFDHIVQATSGTHTHVSSAKRSGASSLFATCLDQLPRRMTQLQELTEAKPAEDQEDVIAEFYHDLNLFSSNEAAGWRPLKGLVRSHAVHLLSDAVCDGLFTPRAILSHIAACEAGDFAHGSHQILEAWGDAIISGDMAGGHILLHADMLSTSTRSLDCQYIFWKWLARACKAGLDAFPEPHGKLVDDRCLWPYKAGCASDVFSESFVRHDSALFLMESMFSCAVMPLMLDFGRVADAHRLVAHNRRPKEILQRFTHESSELGSVQKTYWPALSSIMTYIATVSVFSNGDENIGWPVLQRFLAHSMTGIALGAIDQLDSHQRAVLFMPWLSSLFVASLKPEEQYNASTGMEAFLDLAEESDDFTLSHLLSEHIMNMAKSCSLAADMEGKMDDTGEDARLSFMKSGPLTFNNWPGDCRFDSRKVKPYFQQMVHALLQLANIEQAKFFLRIATDAACDWADLTEATADIKFAKRITQQAHDIQDRVNDKLGVSDNEFASPKHFSTPDRGGESYRWEECISSWVMRTPTKKSQKKLQVIVPAVKDVQSPVETELSIRSIPQPWVVVPALSDVTDKTMRISVKRRRSSSEHGRPTLRRRFSNPGLGSGTRQAWRDSSPERQPRRVIRSRSFASRRSIGVAALPNRSTGTKDQDEARSSDSEDELTRIRP